MKKQLLFVLSALTVQSTMPITGAVMAWYMGPYTKEAQDVHDLPGNPKSAAQEDIWKVRCVNNEVVTVAMPDGTEADDVSIICSQCKSPKGRCRVDFRNVQFDDNKDHKHFVLKQGKKIQHVRVTKTVKKSRKNKKDEGYESN